MAGNSVGIDYHQKQLQVCITTDGGKVLWNKSCPNDVPALMRILESHGPVASVAAEACTGSANFLDSLQRMAGYQV